MKSAIITLVRAESRLALSDAFYSFAEQCGVPCHVFVIGKGHPFCFNDLIRFHSLKPDPTWGHPLREIYYRRLQVIDEIQADHVLVVDALDVVCLRPLPMFNVILSGADVAAAPECKPNYAPFTLNAGVVFWNRRFSQDIREEVIKRGQARFRTVADDQQNLNEVLTRCPQRVKILPTAFNCRADFQRKRFGWPSVENLDGVFIYHNLLCMEQAKKIVHRQHARPRELEAETSPPRGWRQWVRRIRSRLA